MATKEELMRALRAADAAGDAPAAQAIATRIKSMATAGAGPAQPATLPLEGALRADGSDSLADRIKYGTAGVGIQAYLGAKQLLGKLSPEEINILNQSKADVEHSGFAGKAANLVGNVGLGTAASILTPAIAMPAAVGKGAVYLKAALGSGLMAAGTTPVEDQDNIIADKAKEAAKAAALGPAAVALGQGVAKVGTGLFKATKDAMDLFQQGINPTLQQAAESKVGRFIGGLTSGFSDVRGRQENEVADALTKRISAGGVAAPGATVAQRLDMLNQGISSDYDSVLKGKLFPMTNSIRDDVLRQGDNIGQSGGRFQSQVGDARASLDNIIGTDRNAVRMGSDLLRKNYTDPLQQAIADAKDPKVADALISAKNIIVEKSRNAKLSPDELASLQDIDKRYFDLMRLKQAGNINETGVDINKLSNAYAKGPGMDVLGAHNATNEELIGPLVRTIGTTPRQDEARTMLNTVRRMLPLAGGAAAGAVTGTTPILAAGAAPLYALSAAGQTAKGARFLTGQNPWQQSLKDALDSPATNEATVANILRALRDNSSTLGAGLTAGQ